MKGFGRVKIPPPSSVDFRANFFIYYKEVFDMTWDGIILSALFPFFLLLFLTWLYG